MIDSSICMGQHLLYRYYKARTWCEPLCSALVVVKAISCCFVINVLNTFHSILSTTTSGAHVINHVLYSLAVICVLNKLSSTSHPRSAETTAPGPKLLECVGIWQACCSGKERLAVEGANYWPSFRYVLMTRMPPGVHVDCLLSERRCAASICNLGPLRLTCST